MPRRILHYRQWFPGAWSPHQDVTLVMALSVPRHHGLGRLWLAITSPSDVTWAACKVLMLPSRLEQLLAKYAASRFLLSLHDSKCSCSQLSVSSSYVLMVKLWLPSTVK